VTYQKGFQTVVWGPKGCARRIWQRSTTACWKYSL